MSRREDEAEADRYNEANKTIAEQIREARSKRTEPTFAVAKAVLIKWISSVIRFDVAQGKEYFEVSIGPHGMLDNNVPRSFAASDAGKDCVNSWAVSQGLTCDYTWHNVSDTITYKFALNDERKEEET